MARVYGSAMTIISEFGEQARVLDVCATLARGCSVAQGCLDAVPEVTIDDRIMFGGSEQADA